MQTTTAHPAISRSNESQQISNLTTTLKSDDDSNEELVTTLSNNTEDLDLDFTESDEKTTQEYNLFDQTISDSTGSVATELGGELFTAEENEQFTTDLTTESSVELQSEQNPRHLKNVIKLSRNTKDGEQKSAMLHGIFGTNMGVEEKQTNCSYIEGMELLSQMAQHTSIEAWSYECQLGCVAPFYGQGSSHNSCEELTQGIEVNSGFIFETIQSCPITTPSEAFHCLNQTLHYLDQLNNHLISVVPPQIEDPEAELCDQSMKERNYLLGNVSSQLNSTKVALAWMENINTQQMDSLGIEPSTGDGLTFTPPNIPDIEEAFKQILVGTTHIDREMLLVQEKFRQLYEECKLLN